MQHNMTKVIQKTVYDSTSTLEELIAGCVQQNRMAQKYLYKRFYSGMFGVAMRYTRDREEAQEVLNNAFIKVFKSIGSYRPTGSFPAWIKKIVIHTSIDYIRKYARFKGNAPLGYAANVALPNDIIARLSAEEIYTCIQKLSPTSKTVFSMHALDGFKHREIAEVLNISPNTSKWYLANAKAALQKIINLNK